MSENNKEDNNQLTKQKEIEKEIIQSRPEISQLIANNQVKKVYEGKNEVVKEHTNGDAFGFYIEKKEYRGIEFYKNQQKTQEIPPSEKKTQSLGEQLKSVESENSIKVNQGAEISPQKPEKMVENLVNPGTTNNSNTNDKNTSGDEN
jgi:hypothetical protein